MVLKSLTRNQNILNVTFLKLLFNLETLSGHDFHTDALQFLLFLLNSSNKSANLIFFLSIFRWVHVVCALYVPGVAFGDIDKLRPVTLTEMNYSKYGAKASIIIINLFIFKPLDAGWTVPVDSGLQTCLTSCQEPL